MKDEQDSAITVPFPVSFIFEQILLPDEIKIILREEISENLTLVFTRIFSNDVESRFVDSAILNMIRSALTERQAALLYSYDFGIETETEIHCGLGIENSYYEALMHISKKGEKLPTEI